MDKEKALGSEKISKLMIRYSLPCVISLLVAALYNIVDQLFIANASYLGSYGNAANTVVFPLTVIALSIAVMIGDGACAFSSLCLGKGDSDKAKKTVGNAIVISVISGLLIMTIYLLCSDWLITVFGGNVNEETFAFSKEYFFYISLGIPVYVFGQAMNPIIRADGSPGFAMFATLAGAILNVILDPIFIYPMHMGMAGAAIATVLGQVVTAGLSIFYVFRMKMVKPNRASFVPEPRLIGQIALSGLTSFLSQISLVAAMAAINNMIRVYGAMDPIFGLAEYAQIPMAVVGIVMKFFQIVISICVGLAAGCIPIVGYNMGQGNKKRVKELFTRLLIYEAVVGLAATLIVEIFPGQLINLFGAANESSYYTEFAIKSFRIYLSMMILACVNKGTFIFLQAMGKILQSTILSMVREIVFGVGFALVLPLAFKLDGVLYSMPLSDILTFLVAGFLIIKTYRFLNFQTENKQETVVENH